MQRCPPRNQKTSKRSRTSNLSSALHTRSISSVAVAETANHGPSHFVSTETYSAATLEPCIPVETTTALEILLLPPPHRIHTARRTLFVSLKKGREGEVLPMVPITNAPSMFLSNHQPPKPTITTKKKNARVRDPSPRKRCNGAGAPTGLAMPSPWTAVVL